MSVQVLPDAPPPFAVRSRGWLLLRHLFTATTTVLVVMALWAVVTTPFVAVFLIDDSFSVSEYAGAALSVAGAVCVATLAITPVALGLERLALRGGRAWTVMAALLPIGLAVAVVAGVVAMFKLIGSHGAYHAVALATFLLFLLVIYWPTLWTLNLASYVLRRIRHAYRLRRARPRAVTTA
ncbi:hypothetical protein R8Z50_19425 [Longispora sp. K20-0274]|uniref:hypothetical protein n=1 Tax=Longispora sp. K20-0274 TaxID=3088255 RepID=UPI00399AF3BA